MLPLVAVLAACDTQSAKQLHTLAHTDSLRTDSLSSIKNELLNEVLSSTQFINDLNTEVAKLKSRKSTKLSATLSRESDINVIKEERANVVAKIRELVARLDSSEARVASLRSRAAKLSQHDSTMIAQVAAYEKSIAELRQAIDQQKAEYEATITKQTTQIAVLTSKVDTVSQENVRLSGERAALTDTVTDLTTEKNTVYYVIGTKDDLIRSGIIVEEGHKRFLLVGGRPFSPARELDPSKFTKIDRLKDRVINFPAGDYTIFTRQSPTYASPFAAKDGKFSGGLRIDQPDKFWEPSKFLIIVKA